MMEKSNPYQPPADELPKHIASQLQADEERMRLRTTEPVPGVDFWLAVAAGTLVLLLINITPSATTVALLFAWLGGSVRVCLVYSARARAALPPLNAQRLLFSSTGVCLVLQFVTLLFVAMLFEGFRVLMPWQAALPMTLLLAILSFILVYVLLFLWSIQLGKQA